MNTTEAWVLHRGSTDRSDGEPGELCLEEYAFPEITAHEVLVEPLYGCWEANMTHAVQRTPVDVCRQRREDRIVLGNAGVARILEVGDAVKGVCPGDVCMVYGAGETDEFGYMTKALAYDAPNTMGMLARRAKLHETNVLPIPLTTRYSFRQWAAFAVRYVTAWANWRVAYGCWNVQMSDQTMPAPFVWAWGGGTAFAEADLARRHGCRAAMISSNPERLAAIARAGIEPIDRREFAGLSFDDKKYADDPKFRKTYQAAEAAFLRKVKEVTGGYGVSIFVDHIGTPVTRATLKALARQGVITTAGWKHGMVTTSLRAVECIERHVHVHTHYARRSEARAAMLAAESTGWMPPLGETEAVVEWDDIPKLAAAHAADRVESYFPVFRVNPV
jgi:NADPH:quinone reductase-like Zn-dependent oxidoreductase